VLCVERRRQRRGRFAGQIAKNSRARELLASRAHRLSATCSPKDWGSTPLSAICVEDFPEQLAKCIPQGPDVYFDNVGGKVSQIIMYQMQSSRARVVECGQISTYDDADGAWMVDIKPIHRNGLRFRGLHAALVQRTLAKGD